MVTHWVFIDRRELEPPRVVQHNKQHHMKVLLNTFHLNGHTLGFQSEVKIQYKINRIKV